MAPGGRAGDDEAATRDIISGCMGAEEADGCLDIVDRLGRVTAGRLAAESGLTTGSVTALVDIPRISSGTHSNNHPLLVPVVISNLSLAAPHLLSPDFSFLSFRFLLYF